MIIIAVVALPKEVFHIFQTEINIEIVENINTDA